MPADPTAEVEDREHDRERAVVQEVVAALTGTPSTATDHPVERRRVRVAVDAVRAAR
jgi:hypothetical protein